MKKSPKIKPKKRRVQFEPRSFVCPDCKGWLELGYGNDFKRGDGAISCFNKKCKYYDVWYGLPTVLLKIVDRPADAEAME